jgi:formamidopyrimidine-DNA glycosylase
MTGSWRLVTSLDEVSKGNHDHCAIAFADGRYLVYRDPRRFGVLDLVHLGEESNHPRLKGLGVEPLDETSFTAEFLFAISRKRKVASKVFIMDQRIVVGIGNIYASEALYRARIRPTKPAGRLTKDECQRIVEASQVILREAIRQGGSSIRDYRQASGESGGFQDSHLVYERGGEPCRSCKHPIKSKVLGGRSTYWCVKCQL